MEEIKNVLKDLFEGDYNEREVVMSVSTAKMLGTRYRWDDGKEVETPGGKKMMVEKVEYKNGLEVRKFDDGTKEYKDAHVLENGEGDRWVDDYPEEMKINLKDW